MRLVSSTWGAIMIIAVIFGSGFSIGMLWEKRRFENDRTVILMEHKIILEEKDVTIYNLMKENIQAVSNYEEAKKNLTKYEKK